MEWFDSNHFTLSTTIWNHLNFENTKQQYFQEMFQKKRWYLFDMFFLNGCIGGKWNKKSCAAHIKWNQLYICTGNRNNSHEQFKFNKYRIKCDQSNSHSNAYWPMVPLKFNAWTRNSSSVYNMLMCTVQALVLSVMCVVRTHYLCRCGPDRVRGGFKKTNRKFEDATFFVCDFLLFFSFDFIHVDQIQFRFTIIDT